MHLYDNLDFFDLVPRESVIPGQFDLWLQPEFRFTIRVHDMHVHSTLFSHEEEKPIALFAVNRREPF